MTSGYGVLTMEFQGSVLSPVLTTGSETMLRTMFSDLGSTLSRDFSALRDALDETASSGDLTKLREYHPAALSEWIASDWFEYGKVPLTSQFVTLPTAQNVGTKNSLIAPSSLRTLLSTKISQRSNEETKSMLNMQGVFAFCKSVYTYLYQTERITLATFEAGENYLQAAVDEWHNNLTYASLIDRSKVTVQAATALVDFIKMILRPTYMVPSGQPAISSNENMEEDNIIANMKLEDEVDLALAEMHRNEQLLVENRIALQSIQDAVSENFELKQLELMSENFSGDREQTYEDCLRNMKSREVTQEAAAILDSVPSLSVAAPMVVETFMQDTLNDHSLVPSQGGFMSNLVSDPPILQAGQGTVEMIEAPVEMMSLTAVDELPMSIALPIELPQKLAMELPIPQQLPIELQQQLPLPIEVPMELPTEAHQLALPLAPRQLFKSNVSRTPRRSERLSIQKSARTNQLTSR